jgi:hypothetical protein
MTVADCTGGCLHLRGDLGILLEDEGKIGRRAEAVDRARSVLSGDEEDS